MNFQWDERKNEANRKKHGVSFGLASQVFVDPLAVSRTDRSVEGEERFQIIGHVQGVLLLLVVYTMRDVHGENVIRLISARKTTAQERRQYENGTWATPND